MAEAITNKLAQERGLDVRAESAGTVAGTEINSIAAEVMDEIGIPMRGQTPKQMTQEMVARAQQVITMGCGVDAEACPARFILTDDWGLDDPKGAPIEKVRAIRDEIRHRVERLLDELAISERKK